jgi:hypothetical protein
LDITRAAARVVANGDNFGTFVALPGELNGDGLTSGSPRRVRSEVFATMPERCTQRAMSIDLRRAKAVRRVLGDEPIVSLLADPGTVRVEVEVTAVQGNDRLARPVFSITRVLDS